MWEVVVVVTAGSVFVIGAALMGLLSRAACGRERELFPLEEWVGQYEEDAVEPELEIFDAHHHLWDPSTQDKGWPIPKSVVKILYLLKPKFLQDLIAKDLPPSIFATFGGRLPNIVPYMGKELLRDIKGNNRGHNVIGTVYVECGWKTPGVEEAMMPVGEADMVTQVHRQFPHICNAIIAHADLRLGAGVEPTLQYYARNPLVKGIRHSLAWSADPLVADGGHCSKDTAFDAKFREGFGLLSKYGLSFDSWVYHEQLEGLADLAKTFPDTTIICDHVGYPLGIGAYNRQEVLPQWKELMRKLALQPNVYVKIGGFGMPIMGFGFDQRKRPPTSDELVEEWAPYVQFVIETFGVDRCIMESNFPQDKVSCSYTVLFNALKKAVARFPLEDRKKMFHLNAKRVYRVE